MGTHVGILGFEKNQGKTKHGESFVGAFVTRHSTLDPRRWVHDNVSHMSSMRLRTWWKALLFLLLLI